MNNIELNSSQSVRDYNKGISLAARSGRLLEARRIFDQIKVPDIYSYNLMIKACNKGGYPHLAFDVWNWLNDSSEHPDEYTFNSLLHSCALTEDYDRANNLLRLMKENGLAPDKFTGNNWVDVAVRTGHLVEAKEFFLEAGLKVKIRKRVYRGEEMDAMDCHGFSYGAACAGIGIYLEKRAEVKKFQVITGQGMHCDHLFGMRKFVKAFLKENFPYCQMKTLPCNPGCMIVTVLR